MSSSVLHTNVFILVYDKQFVKFDAIMMNKWQCCIWWLNNLSVAFTAASVGEELSQLSLYLTKQLRNVGISTLLLPDVAKKSLESQFARNDELGIPYTVVLNDTSLKNGIVGLRSRDTTLKVSVGS